MSYDEAFSFESLLDAHTRCRRSKQHKREVVDFELKLSRNIVDLERSLKNGTYKISNYRSFNIYEPKKREIESLSYKHRLVQMSLCKNILEPAIEPKLIYSNAACRVGKGTDFARTLFEGFFKKAAKKFNNKFYVLKCDVSKFFASINHEMLIQKLAKLNLEQKVFDLLKYIINSNNKDLGKGLPIGNQTSQWFALLYLNDLDHFIKEGLGCKYYVRYMDDFMIIHESKKFLNNCKQKIIHFGLNEKLNFNKKTQVIKSTQGVCFLGKFYKILSSGKLKISLKQANKHRIRNNLKVAIFLAKNNFSNYENIVQRVSSYKYNYTFLKYNSLYKLICCISLLIINIEKI